MPKSHGIKRKSRHIFTKGNVPKGLSHLLINYSIGDKVVVVIDPREHKTTPHRRFQGRNPWRSSRRHEMSGCDQFASRGTSR